MNNKIAWAALIIGLVIVGGIVWMEMDTNVPEDHALIIQNLVGEFGSKLRSVSLLSPSAAEDMERSYKYYLTPELLSAWKADPTKALGRMTSSPWPERIEVVSVSRVTQDEYRVEGQIIESASTGETGRLPAVFMVRKTDGGWKIAEVTVSAGTALANWKIFQGEGWSIMHPPEFTVATGEGLGGASSFPAFVKLSFADNAFESEKTNFSEAYAIVGASSAANANEVCDSFSDIQGGRGDGMEVKQATISGIGYKMARAMDAAAGNLYASELYRTPRGGKCYEIALTVHTGNIGNYEEGTVTEFEKERAFSVLREVLASFHFSD